MQTPLLGRTMGNVGLLNCDHILMQKQTHSGMTRPLPPKSVIRLIRLWPHARKHGYETGLTWRIGYYSRQDGLDVVRLVDANGEYTQTGDHDWIEKHFEVMSRSKETSMYGTRRPQLGALCADDF